MIGATFAWFTDSTEIAENRFIVEIPEEDDSAWTDGDDSFGNINQFFITYNKGQGTGSGIYDSVNEDIFIGAKKDTIIGRIEIWDDGVNLKVKFLITDNVYRIKEIKLYAEDEEPDFVGAGGYNTAKATFTNPVSEYTFTLDRISGKKLEDIEIIYIAGKLEVVF